jgi:hypothetical protein
MHKSSQQNCRGPKTRQEEKRLFLQPHLMDTVLVFSSDSMLDSITFPSVDNVLASINYDVCSMAVLFFFSFFLSLKKPPSLLFLFALQFPLAK